MSSASDKVRPGRKIEAKGRRLAQTSGRTQVEPRFLRTSTPFIEQVRLPAPRAPGD